METQTNPNSVPVKPRNHLFAFAALKHHGQVRKYTNEPYFNHLKAVARLADGKCRFGYEIGLCHDLFEDTDCTDFELIDALQRFGYSNPENRLIVKAVTELTDVFTTQDFNQLNRAKRKQLEADRLSTISYEAQTVKYCDLIDNTSSIVEHDKCFAKVYLAEKQTILKGMDKGNPEVYKKCKRVLKKALESVNKTI